MARDDVQTNLRLPADLKDQLQEAATQSGRSLSAEVAYRLQASFKATELEQKLGLAAVEVGENMRRVQENMDRVTKGMQDLEMLKDALNKRLAEAEKILGPSKER